MVSDKSPTAMWFSTWVQRLVAGPLFTGGGTDAVSDYRKPLPVIDDLSRPFWEHAKAHRLAVQCCDDCGDHHFPASPVCPKCLSSTQSWRVVSGRATLVSWAVFHRAYWDAYRDDLPYDVCVVQLEEGPLLVSNFEAGVPPDVRAGMPLEVTFVGVTPDVTLTKFRPSTPAS